MRKLVLLMGLVACADEPERSDIRCDVAIIGGGVHLLNEKYGLDLNMARTLPRAAKFDQARWSLRRH